MNNLRKGRMIFFLILTIIFGVLWGIAGVNSDLMVIYLGIGTWRILETVLKFGFFVSLGITAGVSGFEIGRAKKQEAIEEKKAAEIHAKEVEAITEKKAREGFLSASGRLDESTIRKELESFARGEWTSMRNGIEPLIKQSHQMDEYQHKLSELLKKNDAEKLNDAENVLDHAEQRMLKNIRSVLNHLEIGDNENPEDIRRITGELEKYTEKNSEILKNTSAFLVSLTDYLNSQGRDDGEEMKMLLNYKDILIQSTKK